MISFTVYGHPDPETYEYVGSFTARDAAVRVATVAAKREDWCGVAHVRRVVTKRETGQVLTFEECTVDDEGEVK